jgi:hypothetical protein
MDFDSVMAAAEERRLNAPVESLEEENDSTPEEEIVRYVRERFEAIRPDCEAWHEDIQRMRKLYLLQNEKTNIYDITLSRPHNIITFAKGVLFTAEYHYQAVPVTETASSMQNQSLYEKFAQAIWAINDDRQNKSMREAFLQNQMVDGSCWVQLYVNPDYAPPGPMVPEWDQLPITIEILDTLEVYPALSNRSDREFEYIITYHQESLEELKDQYPEKDWSEYSIPRDDLWEAIDDAEVMVDVYNYWGYDTLGYVIQTICTDKVLLSDTVMYHSRDFPHLPIIGTPCYTGLAAADDTPGIQLMAKYQSMLRPIDDDVQTAEYLVSADLRAVDLYSNMPPVVKTQGGRPVSVDPEWGHVVELQLGEEIGFPHWPGNSPDSSRITQFVMGDMQEASFSAAAMGYAGASASGYHVALTQESSRTRLYLPASAFCRAQKQLAHMAIHMLKTYLPQTMIHMFGPGPSGECSAFGFHPTMADGLHLEVNVKLTMPGDDTRKAAIATQLRGLGLPLATILEDVLDYKQPDDILRKIKMEQAEQHPLVMLMAMGQALAEAQSPFLPVIMQAIQQAVQGMMTQQAGAMGNPSGGSASPGGPGSPGQSPIPGQQPGPGNMDSSAMPMEEQGMLPPMTPDNQGMM